MFLNVVWVSDIAMAEGRRLDTRWLYPMHHKIHRNNYQWPMTHHLTTQDWRLWRAWTHSLETPHNHELLQPLGEWIIEQSTWMTEWDALSTLDEELLYIRDPSGSRWTRHVLQPGQRRRYKRYFRESLYCIDIPRAPSHLRRRVSYKIQRTYIEVTSISSTPPRWTQTATYESIWGPYELTRTNMMNKIMDLLNPMFLESTIALDLLIWD